LNAQIHLLHPARKRIKPDTGGEPMTLAAKDVVYLSVIVLLALIIATMVDRFILSGSVQELEDKRQAIVLEAGERALVLREMRGFVSGLQQLIDALARGNMPDVAKAGRSLGSQIDAQGALVGKLPLEFKSMARSTHNGFAMIAMDAEWTPLPKRILGQVAAVLQNCVACHDTYRILVATTASPLSAGAMIGAESASYREQ
jgi:hypothetical protein